MAAFAATCAAVINGLVAPVLTRQILTADAVTPGPTDDICKQYVDKPGLFEYGAFVVALGMAVAGFTFGMEASNSETGLKEELPAGPALMFGVVAILAAGLDIRVIVRGGVSGVGRISRHLWHMCFALFLAAASLFLGQPQVFPEQVRGTLILGAPVIAVIVLMFFWLIRVRFTGWYRKT